MTLSSLSASANSSPSPSIPSSSATCQLYHLYAQQLNNSAALCIEIGHYERAISSLKRALSLISKAIENNLEYGEACECYQCSLDGCIIISENNPPVIDYDENIASTGTSDDATIWDPMNDEYDDDETESCLVPSDDDDDDEDVIADGDNRETNDYGYGGEYIYRRPIRVSRVGHHMGSALYLIITFNLAIAHHLGTSTSTSSGISIDLVPTTTVSDTNREAIIGKTLQLYKIALEWHLRLSNRNCRQDQYESDDSRMDPEQGPSFFSSSIRFKMVIYNNLSQMYRLIHNHSMHQLYTQQLLSTLMVVIEYKIRNAVMDSTGGTLQTNSGYYEDSFRFMDLNHFIQNSSHLILHKKQSAEAA